MVTFGFSIRKTYTFYKGTVNRPYGNIVPTYYTKTVHERAEHIKGFEDEVFGSLRRHFPP
jgi:hypothetical protein